MIKKITIFLFVLMLMPTFNALANADSNVTIQMDYVVISPSEDGEVLFEEMASFKNQSNEEYKGDGKSEGVLNIQLPKGATGLTLQEKTIQYKQTETGFVTTAPIPANGTVDLRYFYQLPQGTDIEFTFNYPIEAYQILIPEGAGSIEAKDAELTNQGVMPIDEKNYYLYSIQNIQLNQTVTLTYNKDKQPAANQSAGQQTEDQQTEDQQADETNENPGMGNVTKTAPDFHNPGHLRMWAQSPLRDFDPHILMIVLGAILIAGIGYYSYFRMKNNAKLKADATDKEEQQFQQLMAKQKAILDKILELEESHQSGNLLEDEYKTKLEAYKHHLVQVKLSLRNFVE